MALMEAITLEHLFRYNSVFQGLHSVHLGCRAAEGQFVLVQLLVFPVAGGRVGVSWCVPIFRGDP